MAYVQDVKTADPTHLESGKEVAYSPSDSQDEVEAIRAIAGLDKETERKLLRKLDIRIVPMVMWMYLMCFMDRGMTIHTPLPREDTVLTHHLSDHRQCPTLRHGRRLGHDGQRLPAVRVDSVRYLLCECLCVCRVCLRNVVLTLSAAFRGPLEHDHQTIQPFLVPGCTHRALGLGGDIHGFCAELGRIDCLPTTAWTTRGQVYRT